tara:strand:+ start:98 stop:535 length:438 start_codon:yes stop_codon:yes gene_type:complete
MKLFLLALLTVLLTPTQIKACLFGNCGSLMEAKAACRDWQKKRGSYSYEIYDPPKQILNSREIGYNLDYTLLNPNFKLEDVNKSTIKNVELRACKDERRTNQVLGLERKGKSGYLYKLKKSDGTYPRVISTNPELQFKVKKRFKY